MFGGEAGDPVQFGAIEGKQVVEMFEDDPGVVEGADEEEKPEEADIVSPLPHDGQVRSASGRVSQGPR